MTIRLACAMIAVVMVSTTIVVADVGAQAPVAAPPQVLVSCEETRATLDILAGNLIRLRLMQELETARTLARLQKEVQDLKAEIERAKKDVPETK